MKILFLHSDKAFNNIFTLDKKIVGEYRLLSFVSTNNIYNVSDNNNKIYWTENSVDKITILTNGHYNYVDFKSHVSTQLNNTGSGTVSVTFNENTRKFTITDTLSIYFTFGTNTSNSARKLLGFNESDGTPSLFTQTSDTAIDLNPCKNIFINIKQDNHKNIEGIDFFNSSLVINGIGEFGEILRYIDVDNFYQITKFRQTKQLKVSFHDATNNSIELNSEYQIILLKV